MRKGALGIVALAVPTVILAASCQEPTQVMIEVRTNVPHRPGYVTSFTIGPGASLETSEPTTETREPWGPEGFVGSLVVVPREDESASLTVKVVLGVRRDARECLPPLYAGCIVARRKLLFAPHERLRLPITLYAECEDVPCNAESTCNYLRQCVSNRVDEASCASDAGCTIPDDRTGEPVVQAPPSVPDGSTVAEAGDDANVSSDGATDAKSDGKGTPFDAQSDDDAGNLATPNAVYCPPSYCVGGDKCCFYPGNVICAPAGAACAQPSVELRCDGKEDCGPAETCCVLGGAAQCTTAPCNGVQDRQLCHDTSDCTGGRSCSTEVYAYVYHVCK